MYAIHTAYVHKPASMKTEIDTVVVENGGAFDVGVHVDHLGLRGSVDVLLQEESDVGRLSILRIRVPHDGAVLRRRIAIGGF